MLDEILCASRRLMIEWHEPLSLSKADGSAGFSSIHRFELSMLTISLCRGNEKGRPMRWGASKDRGQSVRLDIELSLFSGDDDFFENAVFAGTFFQNGRIASWFRHRVLRSVNQSEQAMRHGSWSRWQGWNFTREEGKFVEGCT